MSDHPEYSEIKSSNLRRLVHQEQEGNNTISNSNNNSPSIRLRKRQDSLPLGSTMSSATAPGPEPYRQLHNPVWRRMIVEWCYSVIDHIGADRELVYIAIHILDRFLVQESQTSSTSTNANAIRVDYKNDKQAYETAVMTCLLITLKLNGLGDVLQIQDLLQMSSTNQNHSTNAISSNHHQNINNNNVNVSTRRRITSHDITSMGRRIVHALTWNKQIPTAARFAHAYVQFLLPETDADTDAEPELSSAADAESDADSIPEHEATTTSTSTTRAITEQLLENAVYQIELALQDEYCSSQPPSLLAWMAFENALFDSELDMDNNGSSSMNMNMTSKAKLRSTIAKLTGHKYDLVLRRRLQHYQPPMMSMAMSKAMSGVDSEAETDTEEEDMLHQLSSDKIMVIPTTQEEYEYSNDDDVNMNMSCSNSSTSTSSSSSTSKHNETFTVQKEQVRNDILRALALRQARKASGTTMGIGLSRTTKVISFEDMARVALASAKKRSVPGQQSSASKKSSSSESHPVATLRRTKRTTFL